MKTIIQKTFAIINYISIIVFSIDLIYTLYGVVILNQGNSKTPVWSAYCLFVPMAIWMITLCVMIGVLIKENFNN